MRPVVPFLELCTQYRQVKAEIDQAIQDVLDRGVFLFGGQGSINVETTSASGASPQRSSPRTWTSPTRWR